MSDQYNHGLDDSPEAVFVKTALRKENPDKTEAEIEAMWQERQRRIGEQEAGDDCLTCGN